MNGELLKRCADFAGHLSGLTGVDANVVDISAGGAVWCSSGKRFCEGCANKKCQHQSTFLYGVSEAGRWSGRYTYYCPMGLVFAAAAVMEDGGSVAGGVVMGPVVMGELQDTLSELIDEEMAAKIAALPAEPALPACTCAGMVLQAQQQPQCQGQPYGLAGQFCACSRGSLWYRAWYR